MRDCSFHILTQLTSLVQKQLGTNVHLHGRQRIRRSSLDVVVLRRAFREGAVRMSGGILLTRVESAINRKHLVVVNQGDACGCDYVRMPVLASRVNLFGERKSREIGKDPCSRQRTLDIPPVLLLLASG